MKRLLCYLGSLDLVYGLVYINERLVCIVFIFKFSCKINC